ncbi:hypothetical protein [Pseudactinotalea sp. Z1748]|uniref:hypothetical protein n=1 Tax=Pseudactinotalea sp. Z1748 TaxID=3413027 RepID=UPI003C7A1322
MAELTISIANTWWLSANQRHHWAAKARRTAYVRELAAWSARTERLPRFQRVHITAFIGYPTAAKADPENAAPSVKACIDGIKDAGVIPDDNSDHVIGPDYRRETGKAPRGHHTIRLVLTDQEVRF